MSTEPLEGCLVAAPGVRDETPDRPLPTFADAADRETEGERPAHALESEHADAHARCDSKFRAIDAGHLGEHRRNLPVRGDPPNSGSTLVESGLVHEVHRCLRHDAAAESSLDGDVADDVESADDVLVLHVEANVVRCDERVPESGQGIAASDMAASVVQPAEYGPTADGILDHVPVREQPQPGVLVVRRYRGGGLACQVQQLLRGGGSGDRGGLDRCR